MQFIELADELRFYARPAGVIERIGGPAEIPQGSDLTVRAARLLASVSPSAAGVAIALHKRVPVQGGLGGGSSDAATVLIALNRLWGANLPLPQLAELGLRLGADVPFFVRGQASWAEGVGEQLTPCEFDEKLYLVVQPDAAVSTAEIFQAAELTRNSPVTTIRAFRAGGGRNDCTSTVRERHPKVAEALDWLGEFGEARLTGTGACVFVSLPDRELAQTILERLPASWRGYVVRSLNRSPLLERLASEDAAAAVAD